MKIPPIMCLFCTWILQIVGRARIYHFLLFWKVCSNEVSRASLAASSNTYPHKALLTQPSLWDRTLLSAKTESSNWLYLYQPWTVRSQVLNWPNVQKNTSTIWITPSWFCSSCEPTRSSTMICINRKMKYNSAGGKEIIYVFTSTCGQWSEKNCRSLPPNRLEPT